MTVLRLRVAELDWVESDGDVIALDHRRLTYLGANPAASLLWQELSTGTTRERLVEVLDEAYALGRERAAADVDLFLAELRERALLA